MSNSISSTASATLMQYKTRLLAGEAITLDHPLAAVLADDDRFTSIDAGWLVNAFISHHEDVQVGMMEEAVEFTTTHCPSGPVPRNILSFLYQMLKHLDEDEYGVGVEVLRFGGSARRIHPEFVRCIESVLGPQPQMWVAPEDQTND